MPVVVDVREFQHAHYHDKQKYDERPQFVVGLRFFVFGHFLNVHLLLQNCRCYVTLKFRLVSTTTLRTKSFSLSKLDIELTLVSEFTDISVSSKVPYLSESVCDAIDDLLVDGLRVDWIIGDL